MAERLVEDIFTALDEQLDKQTVVVQGTNATTLIIPSLPSSLQAVLDQRKLLATRIEELLEAPLSKVLTSMPGIGVRTGARIFIDVVDGSNFPSAAHPAAYAGLAPATRSSGSSIRGEQPSRHRHPPAGPTWPHTTRRPSRNPAPPSGRHGGPAVRDNGPERRGADRAPAECRPSNNRSGARQDADRARQGRGSTMRPSFLTSMWTADPVIVSQWSAETQARRARAEADLRTAPTGPDARMSRDEIARLVHSISDLAAVVRQAERADKAEIYRKLRLALTYHPGQQKVLVEMDLDQHIQETGGLSVRVRGGT